jgi:molecular chaperone DnaJ
MPNLRYSSRTGDLYVKISILVPTKLSKEQKDSLIQFAKSCGEENFSETDGFLGKAKKFFESD